MPSDLRATNVSADQAVRSGQEHQSGYSAGERIVKVLFALTTIYKHETKYSDLDRHLVFFRGHRIRDHFDWVVNGPLGTRAPQHIFPRKIQERILRRCYNPGHSHIDQAMGQQ
jgi:hypothetical protein